MIQMPGAPFLARPLRDHFELLNFGVILSGAVFQAK